jgi:hypothetical protein
MKMVPDFPRPAKTNLEFLRDELLVPVDYPLRFSDPGTPSPPTESGMGVAPDPSPGIKTHSSPAAFPATPSLFSSSLFTFLHRPTWSCLRPRQAPVTPGVPPPFLTIPLRRGQWEQVQGRRFRVLARGQRWTPTCATDKREHVLYTFLHSTRSPHRLPPSSVDCLSLTGSGSASWSWVSSCCRWGSGSGLVRRKILLC